MKKSTEQTREGEGRAVWLTDVSLNVMPVTGPCGLLTDGDASEVQEHVGWCDPFVKTVSFGRYSHL